MISSSGIPSDIRATIHDAIATLKAQGHTTIKFSDVTRIAFAALQDTGAPPITFEQLNGLVESELIEMRAPEVVAAEILARPLPLSATDAERLRRAQQRCADRLVEVKAELRRRQAGTRPTPSPRASGANGRGPRP